MLCGEKYGAAGDTKWIVIFCMRKLHFNRYNFLLACRGEVCPMVRRYGLTWVVRMVSQERLGPHSAVERVWTRLNIAFI